jgi:dipeptidyl aminopeptidase/acylaminoacyl peptidase
MAEPLTPKTLIYGFTTAGDAQIAPDGKQILYTLSQTDAETKKKTSQIWLCGIDGSAPRQVTHTGERNTLGRWSPDGAWIAFVSNRASEAGIYVLPVAASGEARELTTHQQPINDLAWAPHGSTIAYTTAYDPENPNEDDPPKDAAPKVRVTRRIDYKQDNRGYLNDVRTQIFLVDVASGERRRLTSDPVDYEVPRWSPNGQWLTARVPNRNGMCSQLALIAVETGAQKLLGVETGVVSVWAWSPDSARIVFAGDTAQTWQTDFFMCDTANETITPITTDLQCLPAAGFPGIIPPSQPVWIDDHTVLFHGVRAGASGLYLLDSRTGDVEQIHGWQAMNTGMSVDAANRYVVQDYLSLDQQGEIVVFDRATGTSTVITNYSAPVLATTPPAQWERLDVQRGEFTIEAWLLKPHDFDPAKRYPVVLDIHGGPHGFYGYSMAPLQQCLATHGFLVVYANPRGSGSYGRHFTQQVSGDWGGEDYLDLMAVVDTVVALPYADAERTGIYGYSYGGYMTAWTISQTQRFKAAVCGAPCFDLESMFGTSDIGHTFGVLEWSGQPHESREWYETHSPATYAHQTRTPTLIIHGEADERCPIGQGEQMFMALKLAGCEAEFARYPGGSHLFLRGGPPEHREDFLTRSLGWFKHHLGDPV